MVMVGTADPVVVPQMAQQMHMMPRRVRGASSSWCRAPPTTSNSNPTCSVTCSTCWSGGCRSVHGWGRRTGSGSRQPTDAESLALRALSRPTCPHPASPRHAGPAPRGRWSTPPSESPLGRWCGRRRSTSGTRARPVSPTSKSSSRSPVVTRRRRGRRWPSKVSRCSRRTRPTGSASSHAARRVGSPARRAATGRVRCLADAGRRARRASTTSTCCWPRGASPPRKTARPGPGRTAPVVPVPGHAACWP